VNLGYSAGEAVFPVLVAGLIAVSGGWRQSLAVLCAAYVAIGIPLVVHTLGPERSAPKRPPAPEAGAPRTAGTATIATPLFWLAALTFSVVAVGVTALFFHQIALFRLTGLDESLVPLAFALYAVSHAGGMAVLGRWIDRLSARGSAAASAAGLLAALVLLVHPAGPLLTVALYALLLGVSSALASLGGALIWPAFFDPSLTGHLRAVSSAIRNLATAAGPLMVILHGDAGVAETLQPLFVLAVVGFVASLWLPARAFFPAPAPPR
jgi:predicted MFS family arabinose efflux permease